ncbi:hypothetical protein V5799_031576 [Amblyomma americanum]|uniref:Uncharacterized protein n=1 Tax=Amblyomma americanum TaxID=6943 RepID=A0AAQ4DTN0_AMBAM
MAEASAFPSKPLSADAAVRRTIGRQKTWLVVGLMTSAMLLMCTSVALLQRRFDLTGYFRHSAVAAVAAATAAEDPGHQAANDTERRIQELERELREIRGQATSRSELKSRLPKQLKSRRRDRGKAGKNRNKSRTSRTAAEVRDSPGGDTGRRSPGTTGIDISHELEILQGSFGERPLEIDTPDKKDELESKHDLHQASVSTERTLAARVDQRSSEEGEPPKISIQSTAGSSSISQPGKAEVETGSGSESPSTTLKTTASIVDSCTTNAELLKKEKKTQSLSLASATVSSANYSTSQKRIRMLKKRRKLRIRVTLPASETHSLLSNQTVAVDKELTTELHAETPSENKVATKKEVYEAPHVLKDVTEKLSSRVNSTCSSISAGGSPTSGTKASLVSKGQPSGTITKLQSTGSPGNESALLAITNESRPENMNESLASQKPVAPEGPTAASVASSVGVKTATDTGIEKSATSDKPSSAHKDDHTATTITLVNTTFNLTKNGAVKGTPELFVGSASLAHSEAKPLVTLTPRSNEPTVSALKGNVNTTVESKAITQSASGSLEGSHDVILSPHPAAAPSSRAGVHDTGNEQPHVLKYNETSSDPNNLVDIVAEGANKTADDVLNKILKKAMNDTREIAKNLTGGRGVVNEATGTTQDGANGRVTWDDIRSNESSSENVMTVTASESSRWDSRAISMRATEAPQSRSEPSKTAQSSTIQHSPKVVSTTQSGVKEPATKEASTQESPKSRSLQTTSPSATTSAPQEPVEEVVPKTTSTGPPDEIIPEMESTSGVPSSESTSETTTTSSTFVYYTGRDEWIPGENARFVDKDGRFGKKLPGHFQGKAALSHDELGNKQEWPASVGHSHRFVGIGNSDAHYDGKSDILEAQEKSPEDTGSNQRPLSKTLEEAAMGDLLSSLKSAVRDESKNRLNKGSDEMFDYGVEQPDSVVDGGSQSGHGTFTTAVAATLKSHMSPEPFLIDASDEDAVARTFERRTTSTKSESPNIAVTLVVIGTNNRENKMVNGLTPPQDAAGIENRTKSSPGSMRGIPEDEGPLVSFSAQPKRINYSDSLIISVGKRELVKNNTLLEDSTSNPSTNELIATKDKKSEHLREAASVDVHRSDRINPGTVQNAMSTESSTLQPSFIPEDERPGAEPERDVVTAGKERKSYTMQTQPPTVSTKMTERIYPWIDESDADWRSTVVETGEGVEADVEAKSSLSNEEMTEMVKTETTSAPQRFHEPLATDLLGEEAAVGATKGTTAKTLSSRSDVTRPGVICVYRRSHAGWQSGNISYSLESVPYEYCSAVLYCCLSLRQDLAIEDVENNTDFKYLAKIKGLNPGLETFVVIEANGSRTAGFQELLSKTVHQDIFVLLAVHWMRARKVDGVYWYWSELEDKDGDEVTKLYRYFHDNFDKSNLKFGVILPPGTQYFAKASALKALTEDLGESVGRVLLAPPEMEDSSFTSTISNHAQFVAREYSRYPKDIAGASASVCPMIPFWGKAFKMQAVLQDTGLALKPVGRGRPGVVSQEPGKLAFFEFCHELGKSLFVFPSREHAMIGDEYMTFLTPVSLVKYLSSMVSESSWRCFGSWGPEWDDFDGHCSLGRFPLLKTLYEFQVNRTLNVPASFGTSEADGS